MRNRMLFAIFPFDVVNPSIGPRPHTVSVTLVTQPFTTVNMSVDQLHHTFAVAFSIHPFANVNVSLGPG